jgi:transposase-like protein
MNCTHCQSEKVVKAGRNGSGSQRYQCKQCRRHFTPEALPNGYDKTMRQQAVEMYVDGHNYRRTARNLGVNHQTVVNWVREAAERAQAAPTPVPASAEDTVVEVDEVFTFVGAKKTRPMSSRKYTGKHAAS